MFAVILALSATKEFSAIKSDAFIFAETPIPPETINAPVVFDDDACPLPNNKLPVIVPLP